MGKARFGYKGRLKKGCVPHLVTGDIKKLKIYSDYKEQINSLNQLQETALKIPSLIYGTAWKEDATADLVKAAISAGFTAVDTANQPTHYQEPLVGVALQSIFDGGIKREALFLQTKFTPVDGHDHRIRILSKKHGKRFFVEAQILMDTQFC